MAESIIKQTNRTLLIEEINPEKLNLLTLVGDVRGLDSLSDDKIKEINEALLVRNFEEFLEANKGIRLFYATTKTKQKYSDVKYKEDDYIMFGPESRGIPEDILNKNPERCITIPMIPMGRSLNLSNSAVIILYEAYRQLGFNF